MGRVSLAFVQLLISSSRFEHSVRVPACRPDDVLADVVPGSPVAEAVRTSSALPLRFSVRAGLSWPTAPPRVGRGGGLGRRPLRPATEVASAAAHCAAFLVDCAPAARSFSFAGLISSSWIVSLSSLPVNRNGGW